MTRVLHGKGLPGWVELATDDPKAAVKFYGDLFGWTSESTGNDDFEYYLLSNGDKTIGGLSGKMNPAQPTQWLTYLETDDIEQTIKDVNANGGRTYMPASPMPGGLFTFASDPADAPFGIMESTNTNTTDGEVGGICWYELEVNGDIDKTVAFYEKVLDWKAEKQIDSPEFTYVTFGDQVGGVYSGEFPEYLNNQSQWAVTIHVENVTEFVQKAEQLGATVLKTSVDTPYGDFTMIRDPQGAFIVGMRPNKESK